MLALADTTHVSGDVLKNTYGSYLKSEAVQLAHHGTYPGYSTLYNAIQAKLLIWPSNLSNAQVRINEDTAVVTAVSHAPWRWLPRGLYYSASTLMKLLLYGLFHC